jgi:hypothetical protein
MDQVMKESSYHDPKMVVYYWVVCLLEDKFDGLKLNHIARRFNEAADKLTELASGQEPPPASIFTNDQHKPMVIPQELMRDDNEPLGPTTVAGPSPTLAKVMEIDEVSTARDDTLPDWRIPYLDCLVHMVLPSDRTDARCLA